MPNATAHLDELPDTSLLNAFLGPDDFLDCYAVEAEMSPRDAADIITTWPVWARWLLICRRVLTTPFGLSNDGPEAADKVGPFPIEQETETELIAGFDDKHLNFKISVLTLDGKVRLATWVHPHNLGGRAYLALIMPFHKLIAKNAVMRVAAASIERRAVPAP